MPAGRIEEAFSLALCLVDLFDVANQFPHFQSWVKSHFAHIILAIPTSNLEPTFYPKQISFADNPRLLQRRESRFIATAALEGFRLARQSKCLHDKAFLHFIGFGHAMVYRVPIV